MDRPAGINSVHKFSSTATAGTSPTRLGITEFRVAFKAKFIDGGSGQSVTGGKSSSSSLSRAATRFVSVISRACTSSVKAFRAESKDSGERTISLIEISEMSLRGNRLSYVSVSVLESLELRAREMEKIVINHTYLTSRVS